MGASEWSRGDYRISTEPTRLDVNAIHAYLSRSYWAAGVRAEVVVRSIEGSLCFGLFDGARQQVGFARVVTDRATFAYLCDVYVLETHRGQGLGKWLVEVVLGHEAVQGVRRFTLGTSDAHGLYAQFGFRPLAAPDRFMEIHRPDVYSSGQGEGR